MAERKRRWWLWILGAVLGLVVLAGGAFVIWASNPPDPGPDAVAALLDDNRVEVVENDGWAFVPTDTPTTGFILYPGARVDPAAYAPVAHAVAAEGYLVVVPQVRLNMAILDRDVGSDVRDRFPGIEHWVVGGHSLGGTTAAMYASEETTDVDGLIFWASYPSSGTDLSTSAYPVSLISGTLDGLSTPSDIDDAKPLLPSDTVYVAIEGGNHAQFGDYGPQSGDNPAAILPQQQWDEITAATVVTLESVAAETVGS